MKTNYRFFLLLNHFVHDVFLFINYACKSVGLSIGSHHQSDNSIVRQWTRKSSPNFHRLLSILMRKIGIVNSLSINLTRFHVFLLLSRSVGIYVDPGKNRSSVPGEGGGESDRWFEGSIVRFSKQRQHEQDVHGVSKFLLSIINLIEETLEYIDDSLQV